MIAIRVLSYLETLKSMGKLRLISRSLSGPKRKWCIRKSQKLKVQVALDEIQLTYQWAKLSLVWTPKLPNSADGQWASEFKHKSLLLSMLYLRNQNAPPQRFPKLSLKSIGSTNLAKLRSASMKALMNRTEMTLAWRMSNRLKTKSRLSKVKLSHYKRRKDSLKRLKIPRWRN